MLFDQLLAVVSDQRCVKFRDILLINVKFRVNGLKKVYSRFYAASELRCPLQFSVCLVGSDRGENVVLFCCRLMLLQDNFNAMGSQRECLTTRVSHSDSVT